MLDIITAYDEHQAKYKNICDLNLQSCYKCTLQLYFLEDAATNKAVDPRSSKQKESMTFQETIDKDKLTPPSPREKATSGFTTDIFSIKIED